MILLLVFPSPNLVLDVTYALYSTLWSKSENSNDVSVTLTVFNDDLSLVERKRDFSIQLTFKLSITYTYRVQVH